jgi:hypothetical protein
MVADTEGDLYLEIRSALRACTRPTLSYEDFEQMSPKGPSEGPDAPRTNLEVEL